jgi:hypothetical protein
MLDRMKPFTALAIVMVLGSCGGRRRQPERTVQGTSLNLNATPLSPQVHINPLGDAGATHVQIGNVQVRLPGEAERVPGTEPSVQEGSE